MDLLKPLDFSKRSSKRNFWKRMPLWSKGLLTVLVIAAILVTLLGKENTASTIRFALGSGSALKTENDRVNILLLGVGGEGHDGPYLTDSIIVASYNVKTHDVVLISLPRDLWVDQYKSKVNTLYSIGLARGNGLGLAEDGVGKVLGINIPYAVRLDFGGFVKAIDLVGGLDVTVPNSFDDYMYPNEGHENDMCGKEEKEVDITDDQSKKLGVPAGKQKALLNSDGSVATASSDLAIGIAYTDDNILTYFPCRFEHISFSRGPSHMNGETALKFVRSRHGTNNEGSDFARSRRQQLVLESFKQKVLSLDTLTDPKKIISLAGTFGKSIDTNIPQSLYLDFIKIIKEKGATRTFVIDQSGGTPLLVTPQLGDYGGAWVLVPQGGSYDRIHKFIGDAFSGAPEASASAVPAK